MFLHDQTPVQDAQRTTNALKAIEHLNVLSTAWGWNTFMEGMVVGKIG